MTGDPVGGVPSAAWPLTPAGGGAHAGTAVGHARRRGGPARRHRGPHRHPAGTFDGTSDGTGATAPDAAWTPSRPDRTPVPDPDALHLLSPAPEAGTLVDEGVVVRRGDTLWSIAGATWDPARPPTRSRGSGRGGTRPTGTPSATTPT